MQATRQRETGIRKEYIFITSPLVFTSAATAGSDCFGGSITLRSISIAYENVPSVRSNARCCGCGNCFDLGPTQSASPAATASPRPTAASPGPRATATASPYATASPTTRGAVTPSSSTRREHGARFRPEITLSPSGGVELEGESAPITRKPPPGAASPSERTKATPSRPHRKLERREANTPPKGSGEQE